MFPDGSSIAKGNVASDGFYWIRGYQTIRLYRRSNAHAPLGSYCCKIIDRYEAVRAFCANLVGRLFIHMS